MENLFFITIGRQLGSGGYLIGKEIAQKLNIDFYDKELITLAAKKSGLNKELFENADEKTSHSITAGLFGLRNSLIDQIYPNDYLSNETLFNIQSDVIKDIAASKSAVFVGRCADYVLTGIERRFNVFIYADMEDRVNRIAAMKKLSKEKAHDLILKTDKKRAGYYNYFSNKKWGATETYHLCINTSKVPADEAIKIIVDIITYTYLSDTN